MKLLRTLGLVLAIAGNPAAWASPPGDLDTDLVLDLADGCPTAWDPEQADTGGNGARGGSGGPGGEGGSGGGGAGGPSLGIACGGGASLLLDSENLFRLGAAGPGGLSPGNNGLAGLLADRNGC